MTTGLGQRAKRLSEEQKIKNRKEIEAREFTTKNFNEWKTAFQKEMRYKEKIIKKNPNLKKALKLVVQEAQKAAKESKLPYQSEKYRKTVNLFDRIYSEVKKKQK